MDRRKWFKMSAGWLPLLGHRLAAGSWSTRFNVRLRDAKDVFDHILLGAPDLEAGIRWIEERTGVRAEFGGNHPGRGTRNGLLSLGVGHYLEIIAPDPSQANVPDERGLRQLSSPRIVQWAVHTEDIAATKRVAEAAGIKTFGPQPGSRQRPDGKMLSWQALGIEQTTPLIPFFIQWQEGSPHPSLDAPRLGTVNSLRFETPQPDELGRILHGMAIEADIHKANLPQIVLTVQTATGDIEMS